MILAAQSEAFKQENILAERLHGLDPQMERKGDETIQEQISDVEVQGLVCDEIIEGMEFWCNDQAHIGSDDYLVVLAQTLQNVLESRIEFELHLASHVDGQIVEERLTIKLVKGEEVLKIETTVTAKDGTITKFLGKFPEYKPTKEEEEIFKLKAIWENVIYDIFENDLDLESTARSRPRDSEMEDTGGSGI
ncbi:hypothetical protein Tco_0169435 [Tanacetum coccineum]